MADYFKAAGYDIKHTHLVEASARFCGFRNWRTLRSELMTTPHIVPAPGRVVPDLGGKAVRVYMGVHACHEYGESPDYCWTDINQSWVNRVFELRAASDSLNLSEMEDSCEVPDWMDDFGTYRIQYDCLKVAGDEFWYKGEPKHCDYSVETYMIHIDKLIHLVQGCSRGELYLFKDRFDVDSLMEKLGREEGDANFVDSDEADCIPANMPF